MYEIDTFIFLLESEPMMARFQSRLGYRTLHIKRERKKKQGCNIEETAQKKKRILDQGMYNKEPEGQLLKLELISFRQTGVTESRRFLIKLIPCTPFKITRVYKTNTTKSYLF